MKLSILNSAAIFSCFVLLVSASVVPKDSKLSTSVAQATTTYTVQYNGVCEDHGDITIYDVTECDAAIAAQGWSMYNQYDSAYPDVTDGCTARQKNERFLNKAGSCQVGVPIPTWLPSLTGVSSCNCETFQPCLCKKGPTIPSTKVTSGTCEDHGYTTIYDEPTCKQAFTSLGHYASVININTRTWQPDGCTTDSILTLSVNAAGTCTAANCKCSSSYPCLCLTN